LILRINKIRFWQRNGSAKIRLFNYNFGFFKILLTLKVVSIYVAGSCVG